jgi:hypothetical protein
VIGHLPAILLLIRGTLLQSDHLSSQIVAKSWLSWTPKTRQLVKVEPCP